MTQQEQKDWTGNVRWADDRQALLDDFAKTAMQGLISNTSNLSYIPGNSDRGLVLDGISKDAYGIATAMMQERERRIK